MSWCDVLFDVVDFEAGRLCKILPAGTVTNWLVNKVQMVLPCSFFACPRVFREHEIGNGEFPWERWIPMGIPNVISAVVFFRKQESLLHVVSTPGFQCTIRDLNLQNVGAICPFGELETQ